MVDHQRGVTLRLDAVAPGLDPTLATFGPLLDRHLFTGQRHIALAAAAIAARVVLLAGLRLDPRKLCKPGDEGLGQMLWP